MRFFYQRQTRGWDDSETWSLDVEIAKWALPRLKRFREIDSGHPADLTEEEWGDILDSIISALECAVNEDVFYSAESLRGFKLFGEYFSHLWW